MRDAYQRFRAFEAAIGFEIRLTRLATLFRHFPTREALFEALLRTYLDALTQKMKRSCPGFARGWHSFIAVSSASRPDGASRKEATRLEDLACGALFLRRGGQIASAFLMEPRVVW